MGEAIGLHWEKRACVHPYLALLYHPGRSSGSLGIILVSEWVLSDVIVVVNTFLAQGSDMLHPFGYPCFA